jgi:hypothetical protein
VTKKDLEAAVEKIVSAEAKSLGLKVLLTTTLIMKSNSLFTVML